MFVKKSPSTTPRLSWTDSWPLGPALAPAPSSATPRRRLSANDKSPLGSPRHGAKAADAWLKAARTSVLMRKQPQETHGYLLRAAKMRKVEAGEVVYEEGAVPDAFYVINEGSFRVSTSTVDGSSRQLARVLGPSDTFGSHELLLGLKQRTVQVACVEAGAVWVLPLKIFDAQLKVPPAPAPSLIARVSAVPLFTSLSKEAIKQLCRAVQDNVTVAKGEALVQQGERCALYMLESGQLKLVCDGQEDAKTILKAPRSFGEPSLYADETLRVHEAAITAWAGEAKLLKFDAADIEALIGYGLP